MNFKLRKKKKKWEGIVNHFGIQMSPFLSQ